MKHTLFAEINEGVLYALPDKSAVDTVENGWFFPKYTVLDTENEIFRAENRRNGLFIIPKSFGKGALTIGSDIVEIEILPAEPDVYRYKNLPIGGGGYVTGFAADENGYIYCRTDIGGCYSCPPPHNEWKPLSHNADINSGWLCNPLAITAKNGKFYALFGNNKENYLGISENNGESFLFHRFPDPVHGNCLGRSTGERIAVTSDKIFAGSRGGGLLYTDINCKKEWKKAELPETDGEKLLISREFEKPLVEISPSDDITFVKAVNDSIIAVGTAGNQSVMISYDSGKSFEILAEQPLPAENKYPYTAQRCAVYGTDIYIAYSASFDDRKNPWFSYACDRSEIKSGKILRYKLTNGKLIFSADITPPAEKGGFSGISVSSDGDYLVCTTVCGSPDCVYLSRNKGESWEEVLTDKTRAEQDFHTPYLKHENNNNASVIHWTSDILIDPNDKHTAYINTGTGVFRTRSLGKKHTVWEDFCEGIEETVHLAIYSPPAGKVRVLDITGDLGGFSFTDIDRCCDFTFRDENNNRYITAINADFAESRPEITVSTPRGNWTGTSKGCAAVSFDGGITWKNMPDPAGFNQRTDALLEAISKPNVNSGWTAVSSDGKAIIRQVADIRSLPAECCFVTYDYGESWLPIRFIENGKAADIKSLCVKIFSDRLSPDVFYAFGNNGEFFVSRDKGKTFALTEISGGLPKVDYSVIERMETADIRVSPYKSGELLLCFSKYGIFKLRDCETGFKAERIISENDCPKAFCGGYGKENVICFCGIYKGVYGFFRSYCGGWIRINTDSAQFGHIRSICGDPRAYGRFYFATGSFGSLYGEHDVLNQ